MIRSINNVFDMHHVSSAQKYVGLNDWGLWGKGSLTIPSISGPALSIVNITAHATNHIGVSMLHLNNGLSPFDQLPTIEASVLLLFWKSIRFFQENVSASITLN